LINFEPRVVDKGSGSNINIITRGGSNTSVDAKSPQTIKIQKDMSDNAKYDPTRYKEFFRNAVEMFRHMPGPSTPKVA
jgi:hypothetical protein